MPTKSVGGGCYQWGKQKKYCGKGAKAKADRQGRAIRASQARQKGKK
jgi:hypothetical protein